MSDLKLARLPDRNPVKIGILVLPDLHRALLDYARLYAEIYGVEEPLSDLIPAMLQSFLDSDREFSRRSKVK
ncbi:DUF2274 domain-containing protein [Sphingomonas sp. C8-2]|nr:DUF2274 domain-containing protein [Sphingomonas sp. C8-2]